MMRSQQSPIIKITQDNSSPSEKDENYCLQSNEFEPENRSAAQSTSRDDQEKIRPQQAEAMIKNLIMEEQTHAYKRRFFVLLIFCAHSAVNSFQWIQYSSITNIIAEYYGASNLQVNLTSLVYMWTYIPFIIHASLMLERVGLRKAIILGTFGTAIGSLIKYLLAASPNMSSFWWLMFGQTIVALSQLYIISIPPLLAAVWFPDSQVSTATGIGVFGNQFGIALGFIVPPLMISDAKGAKDVIGADLNSLSALVFWISFAICLISVVSLEDKPPKPPGSASFHAHKSTITTTNPTTTDTKTIISIENYNEDGQTNDTTKIDETNNANNHDKTFESIRQLWRDPDFRLLFISYGINVGAFYAVGTVLNQMIAHRWPQQIDLSGTLGLLIVVSGMLGSVICGQLLDRLHAYKAIIVFIYLFSLLSMILFTLVLELSQDEKLWPLHVSAIILGFFMTGYLPLGFEFAAEITYPHPPNTPAGLLNLSAQVFGLILTYGSSLIVDYGDNIWANTFLTVCLAIGFGLTIITKADLRRQKAVCSEQMKI